jgi:very-short-patch-repair endonuclease
MPAKNIVLGRSVSREKKERARELRREMTLAETILWREIRGDKLVGCVGKKPQITFRIIS